jgi:hypothetical protein
LYSQSPTIEKQKCYGGTINDFAASIQQTIDNGYILAGSTYSNDGDVIGNHGLEDYWILKTDSTNSIVWKRSFGGTNNDAATSIIQTKDTGYIITGYSLSNDGDVLGNHGNNDAWIIKLNSLGVIQWKKCIGDSADDYASSIRQTLDSGYIIAGYTFSNHGYITGNHGGYDAWVTKLNKQGNIQWTKCFGGSFDDYANDIQVTKDGGYIIAGDTYSNDGNISGNHGFDDGWILKLSSSGAIEWQRILGGSSDDYLFSIQITKSNGYILSGSSESSDGDLSGNKGKSDFWVVNLDSTGVTIWQKNLGGSWYDYAWTVHQTNDNGFVIGGGTDSNDGDVYGNHGGSDSWLINLDSTGNTKWNKCLGGTNQETINSVGITKNNQIYFVGSTSSNDGDVSGNHGVNDYWIVKLEKDSLINIDEISFHDFSISPSPADDNIRIKSNSGKELNGRYFIYNLQGKIISFDKIKSEFISVRNLPPEIYLVRLVLEEGVVNLRFLKE